MHHLVLDHGYKRVLMDDYWIDRPKNAPFFSSAFYDVFFRHEEKLKRAPKPTKEGVKVVMQLYAPCVHPDQKICMTGNSPALGNWSVEQARAMHHLGKANGLSRWRRMNYLHFWNISFSLPDKTTAPTSVGKREKTDLTDSMRRMPMVPSIWPVSVSARVIICHAMPALSSPYSDCAPTRIGA